LVAMISLPALPSKSIVSSIAPGVNARCCRDVTGV
jgi:hypothetical protein